MPYRQTPQKTMEFSGKIADWVRDIQQWHQQDYRMNPQVSFFNYLLYITSTYGSLAKGKWQKENNHKKTKELDSYVSFTPEGNYRVDVYGTLDFLAENLINGERTEWAQFAKNEVAKLLKKQA